MKVKAGIRKHPYAARVNLFRIFWTSGDVGDGKGYSAKLSLGLCPSLFRWQSDFNEWCLTMLGIRVHKKRSYGGVMV